MLPRIAIAALLCAILASTPGRPDVVRLRGGGALEARGWRREAGRIHVETQAGTVTLAAEDVLAIEARPSVRRPVPAPPESGPAGGALLSAPELTRQGHAAFRKGDHDAALELYRAALVLDPGFTPAGLSAASASLAVGDSAAAAERARQTLLHSPDSADGWRLLGHALWLQGELDGAETAWRKALALDGAPETASLLEKLAREQLASRHFNTVSTPHFRIEYDGGAGPEFGRQALSFLEDTFEEMARFFRHVPRGSLTVIFYPRPSFEAATGAGMETAGLYDGKVRIPLEGTGRLSDTLRRAIRHELAHGFLHSMTRGHAPRWLQEGLAQKLEPRTARRLGRRLPREAGAGAAGEAGDGAFSYEGALSFVEFLLDRHGQPLLLRFAERLSDGSGSDAACRAVFSRGLADIVRDWREELRG